MPESSLAPGPETPMSETWVAVIVVLVTLWILSAVVALLLLPPRNGEE